MQTELIEIYSEADKEGIARVAEIINQGGIVAIPTETVYGLAANALNVTAVKKIFEAKGRPQDNPLIVHISDNEMLSPLVKNVPDSAFALSKKYWPGPLTMVLERTELVPSEVSAGLNTVAVRMPKNKVALEIIKASRVPIAAPSANLSGKPSPTTAEHCINDLMGKVDAIVVSHPAKVGVESTVITLVGEKPHLLRPGAVTLEQLREVLGEVSVDKAVLAEPEKDKPVSSPGMKYKHYAPTAKVIILEGERNDFINYVNADGGDGVWALCLEEEKPLLKVPYVCYGSDEDDLTKAAGLFAALRELDKLGAKKAYVRMPKKTGVGLAVFNRLIRAAAFRIEKI